MIDTHAHIYSEYYGDIDDVMQQSHGLKLIINSGSNINNSKEALEVANKYNNVLVSVGIHPTEDGSAEDIEKLLINKKIVALGEIGLDYYHEPFDKAEQKQLFLSQMKLAQKYHLPVIIHSRKADDDTYNILKKYPDVKGIIHCFSGSLEVAQRYIKLGYKLGIGGVLTFKNSHLTKVVEQLEIENLVVETDAPFLSPEPFRGKTNYPNNVEYVYKLIAKIKNMELNEVISIIENNVSAIIDF